MNINESPNGGLGSETIYGTHEDPHVVMSEKVQNLAGSIYQEFERMIARYDEDVVKTLMPLLVNVLECLDAAYQSNQEHDVELELLREDNEQLVTQYEREKGARKQSEQKLLEVEDMAEGEKKELSGRLEALESIVRMLELKHKNSLEHSSRLEERENELKKEYAKLHERYTELFKTHVDYMERTKLLLGAGGDRGENRNRVGLNPMSRSSGPISFGYACLEGAGGSIERTESMGGSPVSASPSPPSPPIGEELAAVRTMERAHQTDPITQQSQATSPVVPTVPSGRSQTKREQRSANTLYQELSFHDTDTNLNEGDEATDITGSWVHPGEYASSGMGKEVENLILENNELLATKNALNVVKDDLIVKVDELVGEQEILREEITSINMARQRLKDHVAELEEELRKIREEGLVGTKTNHGIEGSSEQEEADVPMAQRKKFTRVEMARVLMERNQYKERFMELQEAVRLTEIIRANRSSDILEKKQGIWNFFNKLFSSGEKPSRPLSANVRMAGVAGGSGSPSRLRHSRTHADFLETTSDRAQQRKKIERRDQYRQVRAHVRKEDGRMQAYGWSLPQRPTKAPTPPTGSSSGVPVPVPVFCRPLSEANPGMKFWCGAGVNLIGGKFDAGSGSGGPPSLADEMRGAEALQSNSPPLEQMEGRTYWAQPEQTNLSSFVWICSSTHANSTVTVIDANNPAEILDTFSVCDNHLLCIASVAGVLSSDYGDYEDKFVTDSSPVERAAICAYNQANASQNETPAGTITLVTVDEPVMAPSIPVNNSVSASESEINIETEDADPDNLEDDDEESIHPPKKEPEQEKDVPVHNTAYPTMWLGAQSGMLYVHSAVSKWNVCLGRVQLKDAVLGVVQCSTRVVAALADGTVGVFSRTAKGEWDLSHYHLVTLGGPQHSVRCLANVGDTVWCGHRSKIHVLEPRSLKLLHCLEAHPRRESQVRQLAHLGDGVWVSIRLDSTLRLYHAHTYEHLQDVDIDPYVSKMLGTGKLGFSLVRITALLISSGRLWIGTGNGVIISVPLTETDVIPATVPGTVTPIRNHIPGPGSLVRVGTSISGGRVPICSVAHAQLSFHGHRDAVKFFVAVPGLSGGGSGGTPGSPPSPHATPAPMLVMSGGEGYIDFRIGDGDMEDSVVLAEGETLDGTDGTGTSPQEAKIERSHLIVWQVAPS